MKISVKGDNKLQLDLGNGVTVSTIWGYLTHSEHHDGLEANQDGDILEVEHNKFTFKYISSNVEVMVSCGDEKWLKRLHKKYDEYSDGGTLFDYLPLEVWFKLLDDCRKYKSNPLPDASSGA